MQRRTESWERKIEEDKSDRISSDPTRGAGGDCHSPVKSADPKEIEKPSNNEEVEEIAPSSFNVDLDENLGLFESHFKWILDYPLTKEQLERLLWKVERWIQDTEECETSSYHAMAKLLEQLILAFLTGRHSQVQDLTKTLDAQLADFEREFPEKHDQFIAYTYLLLIEKCNMRYREGDMRRANEFMDKIMVLDLTHAKTNATLLIMKAIFIGLLGARDEKLLLLREAIEMDPSNADWHLLLYATLRRLRRERDFKSPPSTEEILECQKAFQLDSNSISGFARMSVMYCDIFMSYRKVSDGPIEEMDGKTLKDVTREMIWFARKACDLNPNSIEVNIRLAEFLALRSNRTDFTDLEASSEQFERCLREWPESSHVLHKIGKFYIHVRRNSEKGLDFLKKAIEVDSDNYPCLMDYLREIYDRDCKPFVKGETEQYLEHLIEILDIQLPFFVLRKVLYGRLLCLKAILLWKLGREDEALDLWSNASVQDPDLVADDVMEVLSGGSVFRRIIEKKEFEVIIGRLTEMSQNEQIEGVNHLEILVKAIRKDLNDWNELQTAKRNNPNWRDSRPKSAQREFVRQLKYLTESDLDLDWRSSCTSSDASSAPSEPNSSRSYNGNYTPRNGVQDRKWESAGSRYRTSSYNSNDSGDSFGLPRLERNSFGGSTTSLSTNTTSSAWSRQYDFPRPYDRKKYQSECDRDDNWRRK